jgi:hypothetical protein
MGTLVMMVSPGVLALGQVDRLGERLVGLERAVDGDQDVVQHDRLLVTGAVGALLTKYIYKQYSLSI